MLICFDRGAPSPPLHWRGSSGLTLSTPTGNLSKVPWHRADMSGHSFPVIVTQSLLWVTCFSRGNMAHAVDTLHKSYYKNKANNSTHSNIELTFPSPLCSAAEKKAFHYINLSNGENIQEARWICSRLHSVLLSLVKRKTFLFHFPNFYQVLHQVFDHYRHSRHLLILSVASHTVIKLHLFLVKRFCFC